MSLAVPLTSLRNMGSVPLTVCRRFGLDPATVAVGGCSKPGFSTAPASPINPIYCVPRTPLILSAFLFPLLVNLSFEPSNANDRAEYAADDAANQTKR